MKTEHFHLRALSDPHGAAEGYAVSEGLESAPWFRHLLTEAHMARSSLKDVAKESLKRPALVFTDSDMETTQPGSGKVPRFDSHREHTAKELDPWVSTPRIERRVGHMMFFLVVVRWVGLVHVLSEWVETGHVFVGVR